MQGQSPEVLRVAGRTVVAVDTESAYLRHARGVGRPDAPLPVLAPYWDTFRTTIDGLPTVSETAPRQWHGQVYVCDDRYTGVGEVLAGATGRPCVGAPFAAAVEHSRREPVTVVAPVGAITPELFAALPHDAQLGLFVTRSLASASALAVRTILHGPAAAESWQDLSFDTVTVEAPAERRLVGLGVTPTKLRGAIGSGVAMLAGRSHARDCVMHLNGGGICGRDSEDPLLRDSPPAGDFREHPTACQQGKGCWRADVPVEAHLRASELRAAFVVLDGCRLTVAGAGAVTPSVSLPLTMLEGRTVATAVGTGIRKGAPHAGQLFQALMRAGLPLGRALAEVNGVIEADPDGMGRLVLFGDAGLAPVEATPSSVTLRSVPDKVHLAESSAAVRVEGGPVMAEEPDGPLILPRPGGDSSWALTASAGRRPGPVTRVPGRADGQWAERTEPWFARLDGLGNVGVQADFSHLDSLRDRGARALHARATATVVKEARAAAAESEAVMRELSVFQSRIVAGETDWIRQNFSSYADSWRRPWSVRTEGEALPCPQCGSVTAIHHRVRPSAGTGTEQMYLICARCGEVAAGGEDFPVDVRLRLPSEVRLGEKFVLSVLVAAPADRPSTVSIGAAISNEPLVQCTLASTEEVELAAGEERVVEFTGSSDAGRTRPDQHPLKVVVAADGGVRCWTRGLWLRA